jgi:hypothetical protein
LDLTRSISAQRAVLLKIIESLSKSPIDAHSDAEVAEVISDFPISLLF